MSNDVNKIIHNCHKTATYFDTFIDILFDWKKEINQVEIVANTRNKIKTYSLLNYVQVAHKNFINISRN